jgi:hypothetical protein
MGCVYCKVLMQEIGLCMFIVKCLCKGEKGCVYSKVHMKGREGVCLL